MRPGNASELKSTGLGPGVMQMAQGAPGDIVPVVEMGLLPMAGRGSGGAGTSILNWRRNFPFVSKTWIGGVAPAGTIIFFFFFVDSVCAGLQTRDWCARVSP